MATEYKGLRLFPLSPDVNMAVMYFETSDYTVSSNMANLNADIKNIILAFDYLQAGTVCASENGSIRHFCQAYTNNNIGVEFYGSGLSYKAKTIGTTYETPIAYDTGYQNYGAVSATIICKLSDNFYTVGYLYFRILYPQYLGVSYPGTLPGFFLYDSALSGLSNNIGISSSNWNTNTSPTKKISDYLQTHPLQPIPPVDDNPYPAIDPSTTGGGDSDYVPSSDSVSKPTLPSFSFASTGFCRIYNPTLTQLRDLAQYMWTDTTFVNTLINHAKQLLENPIEAVITLNLIPCSVSQLTPEVVKVLWISTGVSMPPVQSQFVEVDCGTVTISEMYKAALDYSPYTSISLYLPFIGEVTLDVDEVMGKELHVYYHVDVVTGSCVAHVLVDSSDKYQFTGQCAIAMPITSADFSSYLNAIVAAGKAVAAISAAGAGNAALASELSGAPMPQAGRTETRTTETTSRNQSTGRQNLMARTIQTTEMSGTQPSFSEYAIRAGANTVSAVMASKTVVQHSGGFSGNSGYLSVRHCFVTIKRPRACKPEQYHKYTGYPAMIYMNLGDCTGFTQVHSVHLESIGATNPELGEISELLKGGVIF